jgi:hypothetical protein
VSIRELEQAIQALPRHDVEALREWIENYLEDELEFTDEFRAKIERAEGEIAAGKGRVRNPPAIE